MKKNYVCGIIEESLIDTSILREIEKYLIKTRIEARENEKPSKWHVNEYQIPYTEFQKIVPILKSNIKKEWYIHAFNLDNNRLVVIFNGKSFEISTTKKDDNWEKMIEYGESVGCGREWTENIPLRV